MKVKDCMCNEVNCVKTETSVKDCAKLMCDCHIGCAPVCDNSNNLVGIVTDRDIILRSVCCDKDASKTKISDIMTTNVKSCNCNDEVEKVESIMSEEQIRRVPVIDNNKKVIGILTLGDLATNESIDESNLCDTIEGICGTGNKNCY